MPTNILYLFIMHPGRPMSVVYNDESLLYIRHIVERLMCHRSDFRVMVMEYSHTNTSYDTCFKKHLKLILKVL